MTDVTETIKEAISEVRSMADSQTIIGEPIVVGATTLIPVSKVSIGVGIGGGTFVKNSSNSAGAGGTGLTVSPVAFIVIGKDGQASLLNISDSTQSNGKISGTVNDIDKALDNVPEIFSKVKGIFGKGKKTEKTVVEKDEEEITVTTEKASEE